MPIWTFYVNLPKWTMNAFDKPSNRNTGNAIWNKQTVDLFHHLVFDSSQTEKMEVTSRWSTDPDGLNTEEILRNTEERMFWASEKYDIVPSSEAVSSDALSWIG